MRVTQEPVRQYSPSDTAIPGLVERRIWKAPELTSHSMVVLTLPRLYLTPMTGVPKTEVLGQLQTSLEIDKLLGSYATSIDLHTIMRVKLNLITNTVNIDYRTANVPMARTSIVFADSKIADSFFAKLWRRLGDGYTLHTYRPEWWSLARIPVVFMAAMIVFTAIIAMGLNAISDQGFDRSGFGQYLPNWRTICIVGGGLVGAAQVWLYRLSNRPPERLEIVLS
jgi:hypothetical protein